MDTFTSVGFPVVEIVVAIVVVSIVVVPNYMDDIISNMSVVLEQQKLPKRVSGVIRSVQKIYGIPCSIREPLNNGDKWSRCRRFCLLLGGFTMNMLPQMCLR